MRNKEFQKLLKKNKLNSNSGFTLTELLVGLFMSIFVIGALGFGLMSILRVTQKGNSETLVRNESSRALDFVSDEMRRAEAIDVDMAVNKFNTEDDPSTVDIDESDGMIAPDYDLPTGGKIRLSLQIPGVVQRVIYSVAPPANDSPWKGPLVIYRWGPNLRANGSYSDPTDTTDWENQALVDGISDVDQTVDCDNNGDGTDETITYQGFFACLVDDDGDTITEDAADTNSDDEITFADDRHDRNGDGVLNGADTLTDGADAGTDITLADSDWDKNKDGKINAEDAADVDGLAITAQLYFTGETKDASGINASTYSADTKTVARARSAPKDNSNNLQSYITSYRTLEPSFGCNKDDEWRMRTDFGDSFDNPSNLDKWDFKDDAQPQPIAIDSDTLIVSSIPTGHPDSGFVKSDSNCLNSRGNNGHGGTDEANFEGNKKLGTDNPSNSDWHTDDNNDIVAISHAINFNDPRTFNGDPYGCTGASCHSTDGKVYTQQDGAIAVLNPYVKMLKQGSSVPDLKGYDMNDNGITTDPGDQKSLGEFLESKGLAKVVGTTPDADAPGGTRNLYEIDGLQNDQRIIAFEIGQDDVSSPDTNPGVDFQDNIFVLQSDAFKQKYKTYTDHGTDPDSPPDYTTALN